MAVVSTARYNPSIDGTQEIDRDHSWPASHCEAYVKSCRFEGSQTKGKRQQNNAKMEKIDLTLSSLSGVSSNLSAKSPLKAAIEAVVAFPAVDEYASSIWFARVCRTASHELGHCFGMDHCVFYACVMQGTASVVEDCRQPPYLCPIDMAKVNQATGLGEKERYQALSIFCERYQTTALFAAFQAWIQKRQAFVEDEYESSLSHLKCESSWPRPYLEHI